MDSLPTYKEIKTLFPLSPTQKKFIEESRKTVRDILNGTDPRLLLIVGPCSIHDCLSAKEFANRLSHLACDVASQFFLIMRIYCEKPRTTGGWKGFLYDPQLDGSHAMRSGIQWTRELLLELAAMQIPAACEFLDPLTAFYYDDLITWGSIGARTSSSQIHRHLASCLSMPIGFKNGVAGNITAAVNGALASSNPHTFMQVNENGKPALCSTSGNPDAHIVLRGGELEPNYDGLSVAHALFLLQEAKLPSRLLIDCAHHNCEKKHEMQPPVFRSVIEQIVEGNAKIRGLMLESHLFAGNQKWVGNPALLEYGISITDSCLDWETTDQLIRWGAQQIGKTQSPLPARLPLRCGLAALSLLLCATSCSMHHLDVQTQYLSLEQFASFHVSTPDPRLNDPIIGQRLLVRWTLTDREFRPGETYLYLKIRLRNRKEEEVTVSISCKKGTYLFNVVGDAFVESGGILTYFAEIRCAGSTVASWKNPLWTELIELECGDQ